MTDVIDKSQGKNCVKTMVFQYYRFEYGIFALDASSGFANVNSTVGDETVELDILLSVSFRLKY